MSSDESSSAGDSEYEYCSCEEDEYCSLCEADYEVGGYYQSAYEDMNEEANPESDPDADDLDDE